MADGDLPRAPEGASVGARETLGEAPPHTPEAHEGDTEVAVHRNAILGRLPAEMGWLGLELYAQV